MANQLVLSVVVPAYSEEDVLPECHRRLTEVLNNLACDAYVIYVNDGSTDRTVNVINDFRHQDKRIALVDLSRNFDKEIAMTAGLDHAQGDAVIVIDADFAGSARAYSRAIQAPRR